jgi:hypothetical protein
VPVQVSGLRRTSWPVSRTMAVRSVDQRRMALQAPDQPRRMLLVVVILQRIPGRCAPAVPQGRPSGPVPVVLASAPPQKVGA